jgi:hypothetical protein
MINSYPSAKNLGHPLIADLLLDDVLVEEKIDGSQFSFGSFAGELQCRSKGAQIEVAEPEGMFARAVATARELHEAGLTRDGWTYRCEYLQKPKHNSLAYDHVPAKHLALFDIVVGVESYMTPAAKREEALRLGLDCVPAMFEGRVESVEQIHALLDTVSCLGGQKIEGVVIKNYARFGHDGKILIGKHVSEAFKEVHAKEWKTTSPGGKDILGLLCEEYRTPARWAKAVQHMREAGTLQNAVQDIGPLIREAQKDIEAECLEEIKEKLSKWAMPHVKRAAVRGLPEWWKEQLLAQQFGADNKAGEP